MEVVEEERSFSSQIHLWSMLGPFFAVLGASLVTIAKFPGHQLFFWTSLVSIIICCRWKLLGFAICSTALLGLISYNYYHAQISEHIWYLSVNFSVLLSLLITSLSYKEIQNYFEELAHEGLMTSTSVEIADLKSQIETLKETYNSTLESKNVLEIELKSVHETFEKQLEQKKIEVETLQQQVVYFEKNSLQPEQLQSLEQQLKDKEQDLFNVSFCLSSAQEDLRKQEMEKQALQAAFDKLKEDCDSKVELAGKVQEAELTHQSMIQELNDHIENMDMEKNLLEKTLARLQTEYEALQEQELRYKNEIEQLQINLQSKGQEAAERIKILENQLMDKIDQSGQLKSKGLEADLKRIAITPAETELRAATLYQQLREQFAEKSSVLDETRKELFRANEQILFYQKMEEEKDYHWSDFEEMLYKNCQDLILKNASMEDKYLHEIELLEELIGEKYKI